MAAQQSEPSNRLPGLDGLRSISVVLVIVFHLTSMSYFPAAGFLHALASEGAIGVQIFFVISGFLITWLLLKEERKRGRIDLKKFYVRRVLRIVPPAILFLLFLKLVDGAGVLALSWRDVLNALLFVRNVAPGPSITNHFWSLAIEEQFYLGWPFLVVLLRSRGRLLFVVGAIVAVPVWRYVHYAGLVTPVDVNQFRFDVACDGLLWGCLLALLREQSRSFAVLQHRWLQSLWTLVAACCVCAIAIKQPFHATALSRGFLPVVKCAVIFLTINFVVAGHDTLFGRFLGAPAMVWAGRLSYSLYLWQQLFCDVETSHWFSRLPFNLMLSFATAAVSFYVLEQPLARVRARMERVSTSPVMPSTLVASP